MMSTAETISTTLGVLTTLTTDNLPIKMETQEYHQHTQQQPQKVNAVDTAALNLCALSSSPSSPGSDMSEDQENSITPGKKGGKPATMDRRNARERNRVRFLNMTFDRLRQHLPQRLQGTPTTNKTKSKKMSKVDTLRAAIDYINQLQEILEDSDAVDAALKDCDPDKPFDTQLLSPQGSLGSSGSPTNISDEGIGSEEDDLLDVTNWFHC